MDKMGLYAVDVFQKTYQLIFKKDFRKTDDETKKKLIWDAIPVKTATVSIISTNV